ncbi:methyltransferase domain-containing protein [bacterium]|nr:methyltransferase domain-containing protein [bacterium]
MTSTKGTNDPFARYFSNLNRTRRDLLGSLSNTDPNRRSAKYLEMLSAQETALSSARDVLESQKSVMQLAPEELARASEQGLAKIDENVEIDLNYLAKTKGIWGSLKRVAFKVFRYSTRTYTDGLFPQVSRFNRAVVSLLKRNADEVRRIQEVERNLEQKVENQRLFSKGVVSCIQGMSETVSFLSTMLERQSAVNSQMTSLMNDMIDSSSDLAASLKESIEGKISQCERRLDGLEGRSDRAEVRLDEYPEHLAALDERADRMEDATRATNARFEQNERALEKTLAEIQFFGQSIDDLRSFFSLQIESLDTRLEHTEIKRVEASESMDAFKGGLDEAKDWLSNLESKADEHNEWLTNLENVSEEHVKWLLDLNGSSEAADNRLSSLESRADGHNKWISTISDGQNASNEWLSNLENTAMGHDEWLQNLSDNHEVANKWLQNLNESYEAANTWLSNLESKTEGHEKWLQNLNESYEATNEWLTNLNDKADKQDEWLSNVSTQAKKHADWLDNLETARDEYREWLSTLQKSNELQDAWASNLQKTQEKHAVTLNELNRRQKEIDHSIIFIKRKLQSEPQNALEAPSIQLSPSRNGQGFGLTDDEYVIFEERFRGDSTALKARQERYAPHFENCRRVIDLGCGRGEFLELLKGRGIEALGIDRNPEMIQLCKSKGLRAEAYDLHTFLSEAKVGSFDGVFCSQVVEHLPPVQVLGLCKLIAEKLSPGGVVVFETINPFSLYALINSFLLDPSHVFPIHPELLRFGLSLTDVEVEDVLYLAPVGSKTRLALPEGDSDDRDTTMRMNLEKIDGMLFGFQDYAIIGRKSKD